MGFQRVGRCSGFWGVLRSSQGYYPLVLAEAIGGSWDGDGPPEEGFDRTRTSIIIVTEILNLLPSGVNQNSLARLVTPWGPADYSPTRLAGGVLTFY